MSDTPVTFLPVYFLTYQIVSLRSSANGRNFLIPCYKIQCIENLCEWIFLYLIDLCYEQLFGC